jgi:enoyl-CoA hydratase
MEWGIMSNDAASPVTTSDPVLFDRLGRLGLITLNRPRAINALNFEMVTLIQRQLDRWAADPAIAVVALVGSGERGLCAGGDIVSIYRDATGGGDSSVQFWREEYALNATIARYPKPFVAVMHGIVLGGGIGLSAHAAHRIVTETSSVGLPETTIGFVPDVGGTYLLSRAPGELGTHLALTAGSVGAADAMAVGFADYFVPRQAVDGLLDALAEVEGEAGVAAAIAGVTGDPGASTLAADRQWIDAAYSTDDLAGIMDRLREGAGADAARVIATKSPMAVKVTLAALRRARALADLETVLEQEFRVSVHCLRSADFAEGVRAQVIDKDRNPKWNPASIDDVSESLVESFFAPAPGGDLRLERRAL